MSPKSHCLFRLTLVPAGRERQWLETYPRQPPRPQWPSGGTVYILSTLSAHSLILTQQYVFVDDDGHACLSNVGLTGVDREHGRSVLCAPSTQDGDDEHFRYLPPEFWGGWLMR